jgi:hypothetical protein
MVDVRIYVDLFPEPPPDVEDQIKHIFEVSTLGDIGRTSSSHSMSGASALQTMVGELAEEYCQHSRQKAKLGDPDYSWKNYLSVRLVDTMLELWPGYCSAG